jgi:hypothetical protein
VTDSTTPTQVERPWRTSIRTGIQVALSFIALYSVAAEPINEFIAKFWPDSPVIAVVTGVGAILSGAGLVITRIMALPQVDAFLTAIGIGAKPKQ